MARSLECLRNRKSMWLEYNEEAGDNGWRVGKNQITEVLVGHGQKAGYYFKSNGRAVEVFNSQNDII